MCKGPNEPGGPSRCAADTRPIYEDKLKAVFLANRSGDPIAMQKAAWEFEEAAVEYASTFEGREHFLKIAQSADADGDEKRAKRYYDIARRGAEINRMRASVRKKKAEEEKRKQEQQINIEAVARTGQPEIIRGITRSVVSELTTFYPVKSPDFPETMSGWKVHISASNMHEAWSAWERVAETVMDRGLVGKIAGGKLLDHWEETGGHQRLKGVTVYFPRRETLESDLQAVINVTRGLRRDVPMGDYPVAPGVGLRYEFGDSDPGYDLDMYSYQNHYVSAGPEFRAPDSAMEDLGSLSPLVKA